MGSFDKLLKDEVRRNMVGIILPDIGNGFEITYGDLDRMVTELCEQEPLLSTKSGESVCVLLDSYVEIVVLFLSLMRMKCSLNPVNPECELREILNNLYDVKPTLIFVHGCNQKCLKTVLDGCKDFKFKVKIYTIEAVFTENCLKMSVKPVESSGLIKTEFDTTLHSDICLIVHTSGSTGKPKGVPLTLRNVISSARNIAEHHELSPQDTTLCVMPLFHVHGLIGVLLSSFYVGATVVLQNKFSVTNFWKNILKFKCTWYSAVPTIHTFLVNMHDKVYQGSTGSLRFIRSCSSPLHKSLQEKLENLYELPVLQAYAMSEASHQIASNPLPSNGARKPGSVGILTGVELVIIDDGGVHLPFCCIGEVCVRGESVFSGYLNIQNDIGDFYEDKDGKIGKPWFRTGDRGYVDEDGYLFLTSRIKEQINRGGEKISPYEIDEVLHEFKYVQKAITFGVPSVEYGEEIECAVQLVDNLKIEVTQEMLINHLRAKLSSFKVPTKIHFVNDIPMTPTGKFSRSAVAEAFTSRSKT